MLSLSSAALAGLWVTLLAYLVKRAVLWFEHRALKSKHGCEEPVQYDHRDPLGIDLIRLDMKWFAEECRLPEKKALFDKYGLTFQSQFLGSKSVWTADPENIRAIHQTDYQSFGFGPIRYEALEPFMGASMFTCDGEIWSSARAKVTPIFKRAQASDLSGFASYVERLIEAIPMDGSTVDLSPLIFDLVSTIDCQDPMQVVSFSPFDKFLDTSFEQLFGQPADSRETDTNMDSREFLAAYYKAQKGAGRRLMLGRLRYLFPDRSFKEGCRVLIALADRQIDASKARQRDKPNHAAEHPKQHVFLDELVKTGADRVTIRGILLSAFTAAHESGAIQTENVLFLIAKQPWHFWDRICSEAAGLRGEELTVDNLRRLRFTRAAIDEANRLYPVIGANGRAALRDTVLPRGGGTDGRSPIFVAKDTPVLTFPYVLHRIPESFGQDAERFRPQRWIHHETDETSKDEGQRDDISLEGQQDIRHSANYIPFGFGPRRCPAQERAIFETLVVTTRLAQTFKKIESRDERDWQEKAGLVSRNRNGCKVALTPT